MNDPRLRDRFGSYRLTGSLPSSNDTGELYTAEHIERGDRAAVHVLHPAFGRKPSGVERWAREASAAGAGGHPGIARALEYGYSDRDEAYLAMEPLTGVYLNDWLVRGPLPLADAVDVASQIARALHAAHVQGVVHGGLTARCIALAPTAERVSGTRAKVLDFGMAHLDPGPQCVGMVYGTPLYLSPEQCRGVRFDHRSDLYSFGCLLFHILCGRGPFVHDSFGQILVDHVTAPPPDPRSVDPGIPPALSTLALQLMAKDAAARPASMAVVGNVLDHVRGAMGVATD